MKALTVPSHSIITDHEIHLALERHNGSIHFPHRDKQYYECRIFHKDGTVQVSGNFELSQLSPSGICHCFVRKGYYSDKTHRIGCYLTPVGHLIGVPVVGHAVFNRPKYFIQRESNRIVLSRNKGILSRNDLYSFRTLPKYWIDWDCLILTLELGGVSNA